MSETLSLILKLIAILIVTRYKISTEPFLQDNFDLFLKELNILYKNQVLAKKYLQLIRYLVQRCSNQRTGSNKQGVVQQPTWNGHVQDGTS